ncbi:MAG TPA: DUF4136 domain-containing protein [Thermoanaerobaculia bacterium]|nr:DUF4136 domain-containing protein [Thermoanaerobaculia bacterium]
MRNTMAAGVLLALAACATGLDVHTRYDKEIDFSRYRTYAWTDGVEARTESVESAIHDAVERGLASEGLRQVDEASSPDLYVATSASVEENRVVQADQWGYDLGPVGVGSARVPVTTIPMGTLWIDLVDVDTGKLVWRGEASRAIDGRVSQGAVQKVVSEIFRKYPPEG